MGTGEMIRSRSRGSVKDHFNQKLPVIVLSYDRAPNALALDGEHELHVVRCRQCRRGPGTDQQPRPGDCLDVAHFPPSADDTLSDLATPTPFPADSVGGIVTCQLLVFAHRSPRRLQNHTRTVVLRWKWTAKEGDVSGCYDSCDVLRFNDVCKHCREVQPAGSRLFDERQADRCYHHADVASASIPDDATRACLRIDGIEDRPRILLKILLFQGRTPFIPTCCRSLPPFALNTLSLKQGKQRHWPVWVWAIVPE